MDLNQLKQLDQEYVAHTYARYDLAADAGTGATLNDVEGAPLIDFSAGIGVNALGFASPKWLEAVKAQLDKLQHISNLYYTEPMLLLAEKLCKRTGMRRVFFGNSGAEANECAIKTARLYGEAKYGPQRCEIVALVNSFHGRTIATLAATGQDSFHRHFGPFPQGFVHARANDIADLNAKITANTCAVFVECVQGEGGVIPLEQGFVDALKAICAERDILLMADEVQTGVGRTGKFLCSEHYGLRPDVVTLAKGLGGGLPIGAALFGEKTMDTLAPGDHGSTFGGNPVVCAGACAVLDMLDDGLLSEVAAKGAYLREKILAMPDVAGVTGLGLMLGVELAGGTAADVVKAAAAKGLVVLTAKHKVRLLPPLTITQRELDLGLDILAEAIGQSGKGETGQ